LRWAVAGGFGRSRFGRRPSSSSTVGIAAMPLDAQPAEKGALQQFRIEAIGLRAPMFARHRAARGMNDVGLDITCPQPPRQPEAVAPGLIGNHDAF
jgi:hypothetical protein